MMMDSKADEEQFNFEVEERTAIMIFDGNLPEKVAKELAKADVLKSWESSLFKK